MPSDDDEKDRDNVLEHREQFPGWSRKMEMLAMAKGDIYGVFSDLGTNPQIGYQAIPGGAAGNVERRKWNELSITLSGKIGGKIKNQALGLIFSDTFRSASQPPAAGQPDRRPFRLALSMQAVAQDCARASEQGNAIARGEFTLALQSFQDSGSQS